MLTTASPEPAGSRWSLPVATAGRPAWVQRAWLVSQLEPAIAAATGGGVADRFVVREHPSLEVGVSPATRADVAHAAVWRHRSAFGRLRTGVGPAPSMVEFVELVDAGAGRVALPTFARAPTAVGDVVDALRRPGGEHHRACAVADLDAALADPAWAWRRRAGFRGTSSGGIRFAMIDGGGDCGWATELYEWSARLERFYASILGGGHDRDGVPEDSHP